MSYASRLSPEAKQAAREADLRRWAQHIRSEVEFQRVLMGAAPAKRQALRELLLPMLTFEREKTTTLETPRG